MTLEDVFLYLRSREVDWSSDRCDWFAKRVSDRPSSEWLRFGWRLLPGAGPTSICTPFTANLKTKMDQRTLRPLAQG